MKENKEKKKTSIIDDLITSGKSLFRTFGLRQEIYFFIENLTALLSAGLSIKEVLYSIKTETPNRRLKNIVAEVETLIDEGSSLSNAFKKVNLLPNHSLALIELGEISGNLVDNLKVVVLQNEKETLFRSRIRSSLTYAIIVFTLALVVGLGTIAFVLPKLAKFFSELDAELPLITRMLMWAGEYVIAYGYILLPAALITILSMLYFLFSFPRTKFIGHSLLFHTPGIKHIIIQSEIARFGFLFGTMLEAGMPASDAMAHLPGTTTFLNYRKFYIFLGERVNDGASFRNTFLLYPKSHAMIPSAVQQLISAGERSGSLSEMLLRIGRMYEQKVEATARNLPVMIEPILIIFIGMTVAVLALGILLPIYNIGNIL